ncbi:hypothetical protein FAA97_10710 [Peteryoungia ipomoeae]|uniref:Uncharacterized protein n=2 Tax=Peteryoungia ipomoeae TaxID=1210932 RepID=A0A4S8NZB2_9HYPH|nr:hypothetical protein FAA97_10710 [Peteryoungia ipomoeae]
MYSTVMSVIRLTLITDTSTGQGAARREGKLATARRFMAEGREASDETMAPLQITVLMVNGSDSEAACCVG